jgi:hypothetical protein
MTVPNHPVVRAKFFVEDIVHSDVPGTDQYASVVMKPVFGTYVGERRRAASRFMGRVQREVQRVVAAEKQTRKLTQQQIADMLETSKSVINREILGGNLTLRRLGELAWALGYEIVFEFRKRPEVAGKNHRPEQIEIRKGSDASNTSVTIKSFVSSKAA